MRCLALIFTLILAQARSERIETPAPDAQWIKTDDLSMIALERERLANQLTAYVAHSLHSSSRSKRGLWSQRLLGLALTIHPTNPRAVQTGQALSSDEKVPELGLEVDPEVLGQLLFHRATHLVGSKSLADQAIAPFLMAASAYIHPDFEDAVYASERHHLEKGGLNWHPISGEPSPES